MIPAHDLLARVRVDQSHLESWLSEGWLVPRSGAAPLFSEVDVARAQLIRDLQEDFGVNDEGISLILHLLDQLHGIRRQMHALMEHVRRARQLDGDMQ